MFRQGLADRLAASGARFRALSTASKISLLFLVFVALVAVFAPWVATHDPLEVIARMRAPSAEYWFGTDRLGRDIFSRIVYGAQTSLFIGLGAVACAIIFGSVLGATAATSDKWGNEIIMRLMDILMAFPGIALAAVLLATFGNSVPVIIITIAVVYTRNLLVWFVRMWYHNGMKTMCVLSVLLVVAVLIFFSNTLYAILLHRF